MSEYTDGMLARLDDFIVHDGVLAGAIRIGRELVAHAVEQDTIIEDLRDRLRDELLR